MEIYTSTENIVVVVINISNLPFLTTCDYKNIDQIVEMDRVP